MLKMKSFWIIPKKCLNSSHLDSFTGIIQFLMFFPFWWEALSLYEYKHSHIKYHSIILQKYIPESGKYPIFRAISIKPIDSLPPQFFFHPKIHDTLSCSSVWTEKEKKSYSHPIYRELCVPEMNWSGEGITLYSWEYPSKKSWFDPKSGVAITAPDSIIKITSKSHKNCSGHFELEEGQMILLSFIWSLGFF